MEPHNHRALCTREFLDFSRDYPRDRAPCTVNPMLPEPKNTKAIQVNLKMETPTSTCCHLCPSR